MQALDELTELFAQRSDVVCCALANVRIARLSSAAILALSKGGTSQLVVRIGTVDNQVAAVSTWNADCTLLVALDLRR